MIFVFIILLLFIFYFIVFQPFFLSKTESYFSPLESNNESNVSRILLEKISEIEEEFKMGKLSKEDYEQLSLKYKSEYFENTQKK